MVGMYGVCARESRPSGDEKDSVLSLLLSRGGRVKKSDLVSYFQESVDCVNPAEKERNRELFKTLVNNVAVVKEIDGVRYVVIKKVYQRLLEDFESQKRKVEEGKEEEAETGEQQRPPECGEETDITVDSGGNDGNAAKGPSLIQLALQRSRVTDIKVKRMLNVEIQTQDPTEGEVKGPVAAPNKPYALPLRIPNSVTRVEICKLKADPDGDPTGNADVVRNKKRAPSVEDRAGSGISSPQLRRAVKSTKASEEHRDTRTPSVVPLEELEHQWLVTCAAGHWSQVYGLLLRDSQLADKKDFMSGFTALHWAAKCGNSGMLVKIIDMSRRGGVEVDVNARTHGGYTPLHIAALHDQEYIMAMLVAEYNANVNIRDNCGKKAYHYLHKGISKTLREMLGAPEPRPTQDRIPQENEELDLLPDLQKSFQSISRLFQPHVMGTKKKSKQRPGFHSMSQSEEPSEDREDNGHSSGGFRQRVTSDVFM
uniref:Sosondowah ankyrin repeat domain family member A n=1 Tax=Cynoglossus semilaevis TaxID=244447 RepID=A0A3P8WH11_CYNSE